LHVSVTEEFSLALGNGEDDGEGRAASGFGLDLDLASVFLDDLEYEREAEAGSVLASV
jgi:hypothetical protein